MNGPVCGVAEPREMVPWAVNASLASLLVVPLDGS